MTRAAVCVFVVLLAALAPLRAGAGELGDIVFTRKAADASAEDGYPPATFPHSVHRIQFKCFVCHESIFKMQAGADEVSMDAIGQGKFCGHCHNDKTAFGVSFEACPRCHRP